jgi:hypothetical protein
MKDCTESQKDLKLNFCSSGNKLLDRVRKCLYVWGGGEYCIQNKNIQNNSELQNIFLR